MPKCIQVTFALISAILDSERVFSPKVGEKNLLSTGAWAAYTGGGGYWRITYSAEVHKERTIERLMEHGWRPSNDPRLFFQCCGCNNILVVKDATVYKKKGVTCCLRQGCVTIPHAQYYRLKAERGGVGTDTLTAEQAYLLKFQPKRT